MSNWSDEDYKEQPNDLKDKLTNMAQLIRRLTIIKLHIHLGTLVVCKLHRVQEPIYEYDVCVISTYERWVREQFFNKHKGYPQFSGYDVHLQFSGFSRCWGIAGSIHEQNVRKCTRSLWLQQTSTSHITTRAFITIRTYSTAKTPRIFTILLDGNALSSEIATPHELYLKHKTHDPFSCRIEAHLSCARK